MSPSPLVEMQNTANSSVGRISTMSAAPKLITLTGEKNRFSASLAMRSAESRAVPD